MKAEKLLMGNKVTVAVDNVDCPPPEMVEHFMAADTLFVDTETTAFHPWRGGEIALLQVHDRASGDTFLGRVVEHEPAPKWVHELFSKGKLMVGHNLGNFDLHFLAAWGLPWQKTRYFDTLVAESLVSTSGRSDVSKSMRASVKRRTGVEVDKDIEHGNWRTGELSPRQVEYAAIDVVALPALMDEQVQTAANQGAAESLQMEMDVLPVFAQMTINGLPINQKNLDKYMKVQAIRAKEAEVLLRQRLGAVNLNSPVKVRKALSEIGIALDSTAKPVLMDVIAFDPDAPNAELLQALLDYRAPSKRTSMYGSKEWQWEHIQPDDRVHARFWQVGADTTRVSSSDPNLQQVPKDGRWIFGNIPGNKYVSVDYSQIEVRIAAELANDAALIQAVDEEDVHTAIAAQMFQVAPADVDKRQRKLAKAAVFTLLFGGSAKRLYEYARQSGSHITYEEAEDIFYRFFRAFQGLLQMRKTAYGMSKNRRVSVITLPLGARRVLAGAKNSGPVILNTPVQGTAAVGMKLGLIEAGRRGLDRYLGAVVHDEAVSCVPRREAEEYGRELQECLEAGMRKILTVCPVKTEAKIDDAWLP